MKLIVGLGNPEDRYSGTRHNLGFETLDAYVTKHLSVLNSQKFWGFKKNFKAIIGRLEGSNLLLVKPQTYMNNSGLAVLAIASFYKVNPEDIIVIHDDLDLKLGQIKVRLGGAAGGHHGVESVIAKLQTDKFIRLRLGIGNLRTLSSEHKNQHVSVESYVLDQFTPAEKSKVKPMLKNAVLALDLLLKEGLTEAQNQYN